MRDPMRPTLVLAMLILSLLCLALVHGWPQGSHAPGKADASPQEAEASRDAGGTHGTLAGDVSDPVQIPQNFLEGALDVSNRYSFTISVEANPSAPEEGVRLCSGLVLAPRLVLTAGHCVCGWHKAETDGAREEARIDRSDCASSATITAMSYQPRKPGRAPTAIHDQHRGEVRPHPELRIVRDASGKLTTVHANLALIFLEEPVQDVAPPPKLADSAARMDEPLITVGYGNDESGAALHGERRFNTSRVVNLPEGGERILLSPPRQLLYQDDSGGPCLRESPRGDVLVGVSNRGLNNESSCLSTYFHKEWLTQQLLQAAQPK
jgi:hypothetical protein